ncbi:Alpha/Beta hydrolase protein [Mycena sanguinolenta]|nr:Alpha/Beta hydrolase protein [Mycena sanguinolenta]
MPPASLRNFLCAAAIFGCALAVDVGPVVDLDYAQYQGVVDTNLNITSFLGIRYASAPTGSLRWQAPTPPSNIAGIQQSQEPPLCFQGLEGTSPTNPLAIRDVEESEDCLFLNVYSPALNSSLPTIVWIHGGGYSLGGASFYNGSELVQEANNEIVVVVIQYRLALFGFLAGQEVKDGGVPNAGLLDQDFALRWVNKNVRRSYFPGDPERVTIWGQSAGAGSILQHVVARNGETSPKLFRAAMTSSTYLVYQYNYNAEIPQVGVTFETIVFELSSSGRPLDCLRGLDSATLAEINVNLTTDAFTWTSMFSPVVDGSFIMQSPTDALAEGKLNTDILLSVTNANEGGLFINQTGDYNVADYVQNLFPLLGSEEISAVASLYESFGSSVNQLNAISGESSFICPTYLLLNALSGNSYKGEYAIPPAIHGDDTINYFPTFKEFGAVLRFNNTDFINAFTQGFLSFAVNLDPNVKLRPSITPVWQKWNLGAETETLFNKTELNIPDIVPVNTSSALLMRCEYANSIQRNGSGKPSVVQTAAGVKVGAMRSFHAHLSKPALDYFNVPAVIQVLSMAFPSLRTLLHAALILGCALAVDVGPVVDLGYAQYQGVVDTNLNITSFLGIRYASAPTGSLRWQAPTPPSIIAGIQQSQEPPQCFQGSEGMSPTNPLAIRDVGESEDCLFLNVYSPSLNSSLPTIVWIHGGGYDAGAASFYNGSELVQEANNEIVVVVIQYRLGLFGFLAGQEVKDGGVANAGLLDQDFALRWVNKNVCRWYRGDPDRVVLWGQSAGAGSVIQHIVARNGKTSPKLFRAAMTSSTFLGFQYNYNDEIPQVGLHVIAHHHRCNVTKPLDCLRGLDSATLAEININLITDAFFTTSMFYPVVDESFIMQSPTDALAKGALNTDILLSVTNANEGALFINQTGDYDVADYVHNLFPLLGSEESSAVASLYESFGTSIDQLDAIVAECSY